MCAIRGGGGRGQTGGEIAARRLTLLLRRTRDPDSGPLGCSPADLQPAAAPRHANRNAIRPPGPRAGRSFTPDFLNGWCVPRQITAGAPRPFSVRRFAAGKSGIRMKDEGGRMKGIAAAAVPPFSGRACPARCPSRATQQNGTRCSVHRVPFLLSHMTRTAPGIRFAPLLTCSRQQRAWPARPSRRTCRLHSRRLNRPSSRPGSPARPHGHRPVRPAGPSRPWA
jgi:hypothetical protein